MILIIIVTDLVLYFSVQDGLRKVETVSILVLSQNPPRMYVVPVVGSRQAEWKVLFTLSLVDSSCHLLPVHHSQVFLLSSPVPPHAKGTAPLPKLSVWNNLSLFIFMLLSSHWRGAAPSSPGAHTSALFRSSSLYPVIRSAEIISSQYIARFT